MVLDIKKPRVLVVNANTVR